MFIVASDLLLREIELKIDGNSDCTKDIHNIQSLFKSFEEIESDLEERYVFNEIIQESYQLPFKNYR